ncbi:hypothetical protein ACOI22_11105 [Glaciecola sp. 2405UD65-10]|uniref:hypothetical protein n=1 Tax=Glaciecola sp. 2405UD65-10 TaxID=3397244 RepID=UPI003B5C1E1C
MKNKLLAVLLLLSSFTAYADLEMCRKLTVGFGEYMEELAPEYEENEIAVMAKQYAQDLEDLYRSDFVSYGLRYREYKKRGMNEKAQEVLNNFSNRVGYVAKSFEEDTENRYKVKITLTPDEYGNMKVDWHIAYGQVIKNDKAENFSSEIELYKNVITDRPAIFNADKTLRGVELKNSKMVEFESLEMMGVYINKEVHSKCKKYLDFVETKRNLHKATISGNTKETLSKSFVYIVRTKDKEYYGDPDKMSFGVRSYYYSNVTEALSIYKQ